MLLNKRLLLSCLYFSLVIFAYSQKCDCKSDFDRMKKTFEENDAGFQYVIDRKGIQAYDIHNQLFDQKVTSTKNNDECAGILNEWLQFFRKGHIGIEILANDLPENTKKNHTNFS